MNYPCRCGAEDLTDLDPEDHDPGCPIRENLADPDKIWD